MLWLFGYKQKTAKARVTAGGASGAFFFFSGDERFIAKSCTAGEMRELRRIVDQYTAYVTTHPETFIVRIFGAYSLTIYGNRFYFMVMQNIFHNDNKDIPTLRYYYDSNCVLLEAMSYALRRLCVWLLW